MEGEKGKPRLPVASADFALVAVGTLPIPLLVGRFSESIDFTTKSVLKSMLIATTGTQGNRLYLFLSYS